jgi:hypothetical protein
MAQFPLAGGLRRVQVRLGEDAAPPSSTRTDSLRFVRQILQAFHKADIYAAKKLDLRKRGRQFKAMSAANLALFRSSGSSPGLSQDKTIGQSMLKTLHSSCIEGSIEILVRTIGVAEFEDDKVRIALEGDPSELSQTVCPTDVARVLDKIRGNFMSVVRNLSAGPSGNGGPENYIPNWRVRNMIWCLVRGLVSETTHAAIANCNCNSWWV